MTDHPCRCGSHKNSYWIFDGYGIELARVCEDCESEKLKTFRKDIMCKYDVSEFGERLEDEY